jgi:dihydrofolate reductase
MPMHEEDAPAYGTDALAILQLTGSLDAIWSRKLRLCWRMPPTRDSPWEPECVATEQVAHFGARVSFVVTHEERDPWERPGGTTFHFVNDGIESALDRLARPPATATIVQYVNAGLIDEFTVALSPVLFGSGVRLFEGVDAGRVALEPVCAEPTQRVAHLTYAVHDR